MFPVRVKRDAKAMACGAGKLANLQGRGLKTDPADVEISRPTPGQTLTPKLSATLRKRHSNRAASTSADGYALLDGEDDGDGGGAKGCCEGLKGGLPEILHNNTTACRILLPLISVGLVLWAAFGATMRPACAAGRDLHESRVMNLECGRPPY